MGGWLWKGAPKDDTCLARWTGCGQSPNACCDGLVCKEDPNNYLMCLPKTLIGTKAPTSKPTRQPVAAPTNNPTIAVVKTNVPTTALPTSSMTTDNPTAQGTESSSPEEEEVQSGAPTDSVMFATDSPTGYPTFHPTELTSEP